MKRYLRCQWAIDEETVRRLERLKRRRGTSMQHVVNDLLIDVLVNRANERRARRHRARTHRAA